MPFTGDSLHGRFEIEALVRPVWLGCYLGVQGVNDANARLGLRCRAFQPARRGQRPCAKSFGTAFPYGTFIINISGSTVMGLIAVYLAFRVLDFPDLTVDGSFPLGAAVAAVTVNGPPAVDPAVHSGQASGG